MTDRPKFHVGSLESSQVSVHSPIYLTKEPFRHSHKKTGGRLCKSGTLSQPFWDTQAFNITEPMCFGSMHPSTE